MHWNLLGFTPWCTGNGSLLMPGAGATHMLSDKEHWKRGTNEAAGWGLVYAHSTMLGPVRMRKGRRLHVVSST